MARPSSVVNIAQKLTTFDDTWSPKIIAEANGWHLKVVKAVGRFVWHSHPDTDEVFMVQAGTLHVETRSGTAVLGPGDIYVVPRGVEHRPDAGQGCHLLLIEPEGVPNTGEVVDDDLSNADEWI